MRYTRRNVALFAAALCTLAVYMPSVFSNAFVAHDDGLLIHQNPRVTALTLQSLWNIFTTYDPELYIPFTLLSYKLEYALFGAQPFMFHFTNLLLHVVSGILVAGICARLARSEWIGVVCGAVFLLHPLNTEAVAWASSRKDLLSAFFFFLAYWLYLRRGASSRWELLAYAAGLASKVSILLYPVVLLFTDWLQGRCAVREKIPHLILSTFFGCIALYGKRYEVQPLSLFEQGVLGAKGMFFYVWQLLWPSRLSILHPQEYPFALLETDIVLPVVTVVTVVCCAVFLRKRNPFFSFCVAVYTLLLLPTFATFWKNGWVVFASDRYVYTAEFALLLCIVPLLAALFRSLPHFLKSTVLVAFLAVLSGVSMVQARTWNTSVSLYENVLRHYPTSTHALNNLGTILYQNGDAEGALEYYERAIALDPTLAHLHSNRGAVLQTLGRKTEALQAFQNGIDVPPRPGTAYEAGKPYLQLAQALDGTQRAHEVLLLLEQAALVDPRNEEVHYNLAVQYQKRDLHAQAEEHFTRASLHELFRVDSLYRRAAVQAAQGKIEDAIRSLQKVQRLSPNYLRTAEHLAALRSITTY